uniref:Oxidoreductase n=1 Tax=Cordyceps militaris TaxID=73501 RepID=J3S6Y2_CORMI|nr:oxidoreductase [Cordyceps militaris]
MSKPTIICLHGRGANAEIFEIQSMPLIRLLERRFECVFVNAPNECEAGPNILPIFEDEAPFYSWLGSNTSKTTSSYEAIEETIHLFDELESSTPNIAGILGFSQGAAVGLGLLLRDQRRRIMGLPCAGYRFGVFAGEVRLPVLFEQEDSGASTPSIESDYSRPLLGLKTPTIHATGRLDTLATRGTTLSKFEIGTLATEFTYEGGHEMPQTPRDNQYLAQWIDTLYDKC